VKCKHSKLIPSRILRIDPTGGDTPATDQSKRYVGRCMDQYRQCSTSLATR